MLLNIELLIVEELLKSFNTKLTGSYISKKNNLNQKTVSNHLTELENMHILKSETQGRNKLYGLNLDNEHLVKEFVLAIEHLKSLNFYKKNLLVKEVLGKIFHYVKGIVIIFGSYAKGIQKKSSDLDIMIIGKCDEDKVELVAETYNLEISLKIYPKFEKDLLMKEVVKNHIIIKNGELFVGEIIKWIKLNGV
jgi:predicted nucleotidyltransferase